MLGQDVEFFLWDLKTDRFVPAHKYFPPKTAPLKFHGREGGVVAYRDGFAVEFNTDPMSCRAFLYEDLRVGLRAARGELKIPKHIIFSTRPLVQLDESEKGEWPADVVELGCSPTLDAYTGEQKKIEKNPPWRTSGAHIHNSDFGATWMKNLPNHLDYIKFCDLFIGLPETILFGDDAAFQRRELYGQAGEFRVQRYERKNPYRPNDPPLVTQGLEYRVCSSRMFNHPAVFSLFFGIARDVCCARFASIKAHWNPAIEPALQKAINTGVGALELMEEFLRLEPFVRGYRGLSCGWFLKGDGRWQANTILRLKEIMQKFPENSLEAGMKEAHTGWNEYASQWGLAKPLAKPEPEPEKAEKRSLRDERGRFKKAA